MFSQRFPRFPLFFFARQKKTIYQEFLNMKLVDYPDIEVEELSGKAPGNKISTYGASLFSLSD